MQTDICEEYQMENQTIFDQTNKLYFYTLKLFSFPLKVYTLLQINILNKVYNIKRSKLKLIN